MRRKMNAILCMRLLALGATSLLGCASQEASYAAPVVATFDFPDGSSVVGYFSPGLMVSVVSVDDTRTTYGIGIFAGDIDHQWEAAGMLTKDDALRGQATLPIAPRPLMTGQAELIHVGSLAVDAGTVDFTFGKGRLNGTVTSAEGALMARFHGKFGVSCSVPRSMLPSPPVSGTGGGDPFVEDTKFETPQCAPFSHL